MNEQEFNQLKRDFEELKREFYRNRFSGVEIKTSTTQLAELRLADGGNIQTGTGTGTMLGTTTSEKVGFHGTAATVQRSGAVQNAVATTGSTQTNPYGYTTSAQADGIITLLNEIRAALVAKGLIKGSI